MQNRTKRFQSFVAFILLFLMVMGVFSIVANAATNFYIDGSSMELYPGETARITTVCKTSGCGFTRTWDTSYDKKIITGVTYASTTGNANKYMDFKGGITGTTTVKVTCACGGTDSISITVKADRLYFCPSDNTDKNQGNHKSVTLAAGASSAEYNTWNAYANTGRTWSTSNENIASFTTRNGSKAGDTDKYITVKAGKTTGNKPATATITGTSSSRNVYIYVTVYTPISSISLSGNNSIYEGATTTFSYTKSPSNATDKASGAISWSSSNNSVATVNDSGVVTGKAAGTATITCTYYDYVDTKKTATRTVTVNKKVTGITSINRTLWAYEGGTRQLTASVTPSGVGGSCTWASSNSNIASVDKTGGVVSAISTGSTSKSSEKVTITATFTDNGGSKVTKSAEFTVREPVSSLSLDKTSLTVGTGLSAKITATVGPDNAYDKTVTWSSSDSTIATVSTTGTVTGVKAGTATITATATGTAGTAPTKTCRVTVTQSVTGISIGGHDYVYTKQTTALTKTITPSTANNKTITWKSGNTAYATVNTSGVVTGVESGAKTRSVTITATAADGSGIKGTKTLEVRQSVTGVTISGETTCYVGKTLQLSHTVTPSHAYSSNVTWTSSNSNVASVDTNGLIKGLKPGTVTITATAKDGSQKADTHTVTVAEELSSLSIGSNFSIWKGGTKTVTATLSNTFTGTLNWTVGNSSVISLNTMTGKSVVVTGKTKGTSTLTCSAANTNVKASITVTVKQPVTRLAISGTNWCWTDGSSQLLYNYGPTSPVPNNTTVTWTSSNSNIASVDANGLVTAKSAGTTEITITANDGYGTKASCLFTVRQHVASLDITGQMWCWVGKTSQLSAATNPASVFNPDVTWSISSGSNYATISNTGLVTGVAAGYCKITATAKDGRGATVTEDFEVRQQVTKIDISGTSWCWVGKTTQLTATVHPSQAYNDDIVWTSSNTNVATVNTSGLVAGKAKGTVTITATAKDGYGTKATYNVVVKQPVTSITLTGGKTSLWVGETSKLTVSVAPSTANDRAITWSSTDNRVATVDSTGNVTAIAPGKIKIVVTAKDGYGTKLEIPLIVYQQVTSINITGTNWCWVGDERTLTAECLPSDAYDKTVTWSSGDTSIATIDSSTGVVRGIKAGTVTITATAKDGYGTKATYNVVVKQPVTSITLTGGKTSLWVGETSKLTVSVGPSNANDKTINWSSTDNSIATVDSTGKVAAIAPGEVKIVATANDGYGTKLEIPFIVYQQVTSINITGTNWCWVGGERTLSAECLPSYSYDKTVTWSSGDTSIATIDSSTGVVRGIKAGTVTITATANDGNGAYKDITFVVKELSLSAKNITMFRGNDFKLSALINGVETEPVTWTIEDESIISLVKDNGSHIIFHGEKIGSTTITAKSQIGAPQATISTTVTVFDMYVEAPVTEIYAGETLTLTTYINDAVATTIHWTTSDESIATVENSNSGTNIITGVSSGDAIITATTTGYTQNGVVNVKIKVLQHVTDIQLNTKSDVLLYVGGSYAVDITPKPDNTTTTSFNWGVLDYNYVAKFVDNGKPNSKDLIGGHKGTSEFQITANDPFGASVKGTVTVKELIIPSDVYVCLGGKQTVTAYVNDKNTKQSVKWSIDNSNATINTTSGDTVTITGQNVGTAVLSATTTDADGNVTLKCNVHIAEMDVTLDKDIIYVGKTATATVSINGNSNVSCTWASKNSTIAKVTGSGATATITGVSAGKTTITVTSSQGEVAELPIEVRQQITGITLNQSEIVIYGRETYSGLIATITPANATSFDLEISHSNKIVTTHKTELNGNKTTIIIQPQSAGEDILTISAKDGQGASATCKILVKDLVLSSTDLTVYAGKTETLNAVAHWTQDKAVSVKWSIADSSIASINNTSGTSINVTGKTVGTTTITATTTDGAVNTSVQCKVTVKQAVSSITLSDSNIALTVNRSATLSVASITPANVADKSVIWTVGDNSIVKMSVDGNTATLIGLKAGTTTVTVTANDGQGASATCNVTVTPVGGDTIDVVLYVDKTYELSFDTSSFTGWDGNVTWTSSDSTIVKINAQNGANSTIYGVKKGNATVTATTTLNGNNVVYTYNVTVKEKLPIPTSLTMYEGTTYEISTGGLVVQWATSATLIVPISSELGDTVVLTARDPGTATITATVLDSDVNETYTCTVTVIRHRLNVNSLELWIGESGTLNAYADDILNKNVTWSTNNSNVKLDKTSGSTIKVTGVAAGRTEITASTTNGDTVGTATCTVTVKQPVTKIAMKSTLTVYVGKQATLSAIATPSTATNAAVDWTGYDETMVSLKTGVSGFTNTAKITGLKAGNTTITATAKDGRGASATCTITVIQRVESIELPETYAIYVGKSATLNVKVLPENAQNKTVEWSSSNTTIASVNATTGLIKGLKPGTVTITAKATDGSNTIASCNLTVLQHVSSIILNNSTLVMYTNNGDTVNTAQLSANILPEGASNKKLGWTSDRPEYITVDDNGLLTVQVNKLPANLSSEEIIITCSALDGSGVKAKCIVTLRQHASEVFIIDYEKFFNVSNGIIVGLTDYAREKLENPNITVDIPSKIGGQAIVEIADGVFHDCDNLISVIVPETVLFIGDNVFTDCNNLTDVYINRERDSIAGAPWGATNATVHWIN